MRTLTLVGAVLLCGSAGAQDRQVEAPTILTQVDPIYSTQAFSAKLEGTVRLACVIETDGTATRIRVITSLGQGLDESAIAALQQWRFQPGRKDGKLVAVQSTVEITFVLPVWQPLTAQCNRSNDRPVIPTKIELPPPVGAPEPVFVNVSYRVDEQGIPASVRVEGSSDRNWEAPVLAAVSRWRFAPLMQGNRAISFSCTTKLMYR